MKRALIVLAVCMGMATSVMADPVVTLMDMGTNPGLTVRINSSGYDGTTGAGLWNLSILSPGYETLHGTVQGLCIDVWDRNPDSYQEYDVVSLNMAPDPGAAPVGGMGEMKARRMAELLDRHWLGSMGSIQAAALQLAVWEIVDEDLVDPASYDVKSGGFNVSSGTTSVNSTRDLANAWLQTLSDEGHDYDNYLAVTNDDVPGVLGLYQDYVVRVPVPGAILLGLLGLGASGLRLRRLA